MHHPNVHHPNVHHLKAPPRDSGYLICSSLQSRDSPNSGRSSSSTSNSVEFIAYEPICQRDGAVFLESSMCFIKTWRSFRAGKRCRDFNSY